MSKVITKIILILICFLILGSFILPKAIHADTGYELSHSYAPEKTAVFFDGKIKILKHKAYLANNDQVYIPVKLLSNLEKVNVSYKNGTLLIDSPKGNFKLNKTKYQIYENVSYINTKQFLTITGYKAKYIEKASTIFIWSNTEGFDKSNVMINKLNKVPDDVVWYMGEKVFVYKGNKVGWIIDMEYSGYDLIDVTILLNDGKTLNETIYDSDPSGFCLYFQYKTVKTGFKNKYYWANLSLPYSNPLNNIEKVYFMSVDVRDENIVIQAKRTSGKMVTFKLPVSGYPSAPIHDGFYTTDPKKTHPDWSQNVWNNIVKQKISIGMNKDQVLMSWGGPNDINSYTSSNLHMEQWVYDNSYIYFYDGILKSWSN
ncbi:hypothetical protein [Paenibacillus sp. IHBB 10380]|uniref:hypothetical protein n=1 Tax=Paenibacillus sp. IHBB 10380 TaxID=1566358 RepID=UPI0005CFBEE9|nr:hypothetical protein [Paenibacillus sp. IHBB 10380]AJS58281.1 hypothetical protein UB51_06975 [Paenibacillus sp. IHBB 10380]